MRFVLLLPLLIVSVYTEPSSWSHSDIPMVLDRMEALNRHMDEQKWRAGHRYEQKESDQMGIKKEEANEQNPEDGPQEREEDRWWGGEGRKDEQNDEQGTRGEQRDQGNEDRQGNEKRENGRGQDSRRRNPNKIQRPPPRILSSDWGSWDSSESHSSKSHSSDSHSSDSHSSDSHSSEWHDDGSYEYKTEEIIGGLDKLKPISEKHCMNEELKKDKDLSSPVECARTCHKGERPKNCYYKFVIEQYPVYGQACNSCRPNITNEFCSNCQCVLGDGVEKMAITVNRMVPGPTIDVCLGDKIIVDVVNLAKGQAVTIHWHGVFQKGSQYYDGVPFLTQCPIHDSNSFRYQFGADNPGTHFWHAHTGVQKLDGIFGALVIRKPVETELYKKLYDYDLSEHIININDWIHQTASSRYPGYNTGPFVGQHPDSILINGKGQHLARPAHNRTKTPFAVFTVERHRRYRFRLVNSFCTVCPGQITIEKHPLYVIESDGNAIQPVTVDSINSWAGERYDFLLTANQKPGTYWIQVRGIGPCGDLKVHQLAILRYKGEPEKLTKSEPTYDNGVPPGIILNPMSGVCNPPKKNEICISNLRNAGHIDKGILKEKADVKYYIPIRFYEFQPEEVFKPNTYEAFMIPGQNTSLTSMLNGITFKFPTSPPLSQYEDVPEDTYCNGDNKPKHCREKCKCTHMINVKYGQVVELILVDEYQAPNISHPFHLHGHAFTVMSMGQPFNAGIDNRTQAPNPNSDQMQTRRGRINLEYAKMLDRENQIKRCFDHPATKDTLMVPHNGFAVIRFRADNPGFWLFHCHFLYHQMVGMDMVIRVGSQMDLPPVPKGFPKCGDYKPKIQKRYHRTEF